MMAGAGWSATSLTSTPSGSSLTPRPMRYSRFAGTSQGIGLNNALAAFVLVMRPPSFGDEIGRAWLSRSLQRQRRRHLRCGIFGSGAAVKLALTVSAVIRLRFPPNEPVIGGRYVRDFTSTSEE